MTDFSNTPTATAIPFLRRLELFARDIKISHTIFAMPWAILAMFMAGRSLPNRLPAVGQIGLIVLCMVTARTVAMAANRLIDADLDARNPRTARRAIPSGQLSRTFIAIVAILCALAFVAATSLFWWLYNNAWPLVLSLPVMAALCAYPLLKRFTRLCHYYLGGALALAPVCAWIAIKGSLDVPPLIMAGAVLCWTAGFDIIYACQDYVSDLETGTFSVPARVGIAKALWISRITHGACIALLILLGWISPQLGVPYAVGVAIAIGLLIVEHAVVRPTDLSKVGLAFFTINGIISVLLGTLGIIDVLNH